jgi:bifunctional UDP-N-acetylglucosamine pyrophosphorylase/glucosamine-1-phosphate N-acetyltransferase
MSLAFSTLILAAGKGTRMKSDLPKVLHRACGLSLLAHALGAAQAAGARRHIVVVGHGGELVLQELNALGQAHEGVWQKEQKGTGHAALQAAGAIKDEEDILILNGDGPLLQADSLEQYLAQHRKTKAELTLGVMRLPEPFGYGRVVLKAGKLQRIVEEKEANTKERQISLVNGGLYLVKGKLLKSLLTKIQPSKKTGEFYLTDIVELAAKAKKKMGIFEFSREELAGVNDMEQLHAVEVVLRRRLFSRWMKNGVRMDAPETVIADCTVEVGEGARLGAGVVLTGHTKIGARAQIEAGSVIQNSLVQEDVKVKAYCYFDQAEIHRGATVGPFAHLRPESVLGPNTKVGNFVEIKKSRLGPGAKVSHLSYVGDATVGEDVNIGCGFIACNYDGINKHQTIIEDGAFVGSDVQAVAPVTIGKNSYVATGTTVTKNVPPGALAISRVKQENKEGYVERLKARMLASKKNKG